MDIPVRPAPDDPAIEKQQYTIRIGADHDFVEWMTNVHDVVGRLGLSINGGERDAGGCHALTVRATDNHIAVDYLIGEVRRRGLGVVIGMWTGVQSGNEDTPAAA